MSATEKKKENKIIDFGSNLWYGATLDKLEKHLVDNIHLISQYPERNAESLRRLLSRRFEVPAENIIITSGTTSTIGHIAHAFQGCRSLLIGPCGRKLEERCLVHEHELRFQNEVNALEEIELGDAQLCWLASPNTISGKMWPRRDLLKYIDAHPEVIFVVNVTYNAYAIEEELKHSDLGKRKNLIFHISVSKSYNLPGIRLSYIMAPKAIAPKIEKFISPFAINTMAQEAGKYIFVHPAQFVIPIRKWLRNTNDLIATLSKCTKLEVLPSSMPYFLLHLDGKKGKDLADYLLKKYGFIVRTSEYIMGLDENTIGISTRSPEENQQLADAIIEWVEA